MSEKQETTVTNISSYRREILNLWKNKKFKRLCKFYPMLYDKNQLRVGRCRILFIGLNPSYSLSGFQTILKKLYEDTGYTLDKKTRQTVMNYFKHNISKEKCKHKVNVLHKWNGRVKSTQEKIMIALQNAAIRYYSYFELFKQLSSDLNVLEKEIAFIDLFNIRETKAKEIKNEFHKAKNKYFFQKQLELTIDLINIIEPQIIIVANAFASHIITEKSKISLVEFSVNYDEQNPHKSTMKLRSGKSIPIFFSSMLGGQRAMDVFSRDRLLWVAKNYKLLNRFGKRSKKQTN